MKTFKSKTLAVVALLLAAITIPFTANAGTVGGTVVASGNTTATCRNVHIDIPLYQAHLVSANKPGAVVSVTMRGPDDKFAAAVAACNPGSDVTDGATLTPARAGYAIVKVGYTKGAGAYVRVPADTDVRFSFRNTAAGITATLVATLVKTADSLQLAAAAAE